MENYLKALDKKTRQMIRLISRQADGLHLRAYLIGGVVRDILLKKKNLDLDVIVEGDVTRLAYVLARKWKKARVIFHQQFGTASIVVPAGICIDLASTRKEEYGYSGALPTVRPGRLEDDLHRRDFTINAMAIAINRTSFGELHDRFGGINDLAEKKIRILHGQSFVDDPTRILRAVRFEQRLCFRIERWTGSLIKDAIDKKIVNHVKPQRYFKELKKILCEAEPVKMLRRLQTIGWLPLFRSPKDINLRALNFMHFRIQKIRRKPFYHQVTCWWLVYFLGMVAQCQKRAVNKLLSDIHFTKIERRSIDQMLDTKGLLAQLSCKKLSSSQVYQILRPLNPVVVAYLRIVTSREMIARRLDRFVRKDQHIRLQITGKDLKRLGMGAGKAMGSVLEKILYWKIDRNIRTQREELNLALLILKKTGITPSGVNGRKLTIGANRKN